MSGGMDVAARAQAVADAARDGAAWLAENRGVAAGSPEAQGFRRFARRAARLRAAAGRPTAVAVFGASQAGKSYLVSSLATRTGEPLVAQYGQHALHFLRDMNPQGDKEATGLVTRFTVAPVPAPPAFPIAVRLLSQTDVVKIVANAFLEDFKLEVLAPVDPGAVSALFDRLEQDAGPGPTGAMTRDDVEELREYCEQYFRNNPVLAELGAAYWARAAEVVPRLPPNRRAEAFAPLWAGTAPLTAVLGRLLAALEGLGFPEVAFCGIDALVPREAGILNADTVFAVAEGGRGDVRVQGANGVVATLDKSQLAALVAELTFPLADRPWDFFEHTDLLDFPGARSREVIRAVSFLDDPGRLGRVFLRGKVAYLFQRYNAEQEIAAMLLCVGPSNQDVQTLPEMVDGWIGQTIGATPAARAKQRASLFVVLTKFDSEFVEKAGEDVGSGQRWSTRLQASLLDFFGKAYDWPRDWDGRPFRNVFWLRSTAVAFDRVYDRDADGREVLAARAAGFLPERRAAFLANESVRAHFAEPAAAWEAGLSANDGGISFLAGRLRPVCDPALKAEQIAGRLHDLAGDIDRQLRPLFHDGDVAAELERARLRARELARELVACAQAQRFGALLRALQVSGDQVASIYWRLLSEPEEDGPVGTASDAGAYGDLLGDLLGDTPAAPAVARDRFELFSERAIADWSRGMRAFSERPDTERSFRLSRDTAQVLVGELERASRRLRLQERLTEALHRQASFQQRGAAAAQKPTVVAEQAINEFVHTLGFGALSPEQRPRARQGPVFAPRPAVTGMPPIGPKPAPYDLVFHADWIVAMARTMEDNVQDAASGPVDVVQNGRLGRVLQALGAAA